MFVSGCAEDKKSETPVVKECALPADQSATLEGKWNVKPVQIALQAGAFSAEEKSAIIQAADSWNSFYEKSLGFKIFEYGDPSSPRESGGAKPAQLCATSIIAGDKFSGTVNIYKLAQWSSSNHQAIALTSLCPTAGKPLPAFKMAMLEVNYQDFFVSGKKQPDLQSIMLHEMGHIVGLDHSCNTTQKSGFPLCSDPALPPDYFQAVMYPVILFDSGGFGEQRRSLQTNDMGRANCLYQDSATAN